MNLESNEEGLLRAYYGREEYYRRKIEELYELGNIGVISPDEMHYKIESLELQHKKERENMNNQYGPCTASNFMMGTSYAPSSCFDGGYWGTPSSMPPETPEQRKEREKNLTKQQKERERQREKEWREWKLAKLPDYKKLKIMKITKQLLKQYYFEREVKHLMSGVKWFLFFLGLAVLFNFSRLLELIRVLVLKH